MAYSIWDKQPEQALPKLPFELIVSLAEMTRKKEEEADTAADKINDSLLNIPAIPKDVTGRDQRIGELQQQIYDITDRYSNNMAQALPALKSLQREINKEMTTGYLSGVKNRYNGYLESVKNAKELEQEFIKSNGKQGMSPEDVQNMLNRELTDVNYNGAPIQRNPDGSWQSYKPFERQATYNFADKSNELGKWMGEHPEVVTQLSGLDYKPDTGYYAYGDVKKTVQTSEAIERALKAYFRNDPEATKYIDWEAGVSGKHDAARKMVTEGMQRGYVPVYDNMRNEVGAYNPETWIRDVYTENLYSKADAAARAASSIYTRNEIDRSQGFQWNKLAEDQRKSQEEAGLSIIGEAPMAEVPGVGLDPSIFDANAGINTTGKYLFTSNPKTGEPRYLDPQGNTITREEYNKAIEAQKGGISYIDFKTLSEPQQKYVSSYLRTLAKNPDLSEAVNRIMENKASDEDRKLIYPMLKNMVEAGNKTNQMNSTVISLNDPDERKFVNRLLSGTSNEVLSVKDLSTGFAGNLYVHLPNGQSVPYKDFIANIKNNAGADSQVSIQGKLRGANAFTNATGEKNFGNAYQIVIEGVPYYVHGDYQFDTSTEKGARKEQERVANQYTAMFGQAQATPTGTLQGSFFGTPIEWSYIPDQNDPKKGTYYLTGWGDDGNGGVIPVVGTQGTTFSSADEMQRALTLLKIQQDQLGK